MLLPVKDVALRHLVVPLGHQGLLHLVLDLLHRNPVIDVETAQNVGHRLLRGE